MSMTFPSPYSDMGTLPVMSFFFFSTGPIMFAIYAAYVIVQKISALAGFGVVPTEEPIQEKAWIIQTVQIFKIYIHMEPKKDIWDLSYYFWALVSDLFLVKFLI